MTPSQETAKFIDTDYSLEREAACTAQARREGAEILKGDGHTLVFDLDSEYAYKGFMKRVAFLKEKFAMMHLVVTRSKSGNYHAVAELDPIFPKVDPVLALAIQACLGSDWKKEMLGCLRTLNYQASESVLFRPQPLRVVYEWRKEED